MQNDEPWLASYLDAVHTFNRDIIGYPIPVVPQMLDTSRAAWAETVISEEVTELIDATTLEDQADALVDIAYFALGRLIEMGIVPGLVFDEVHEANMQKVRGERSKRKGSKGFDAIKPEGWTAPDLQPYLELKRNDLFTLLSASKSADTVLSTGHGSQSLDAQKPRVLVIGHARHGKDTVAEILSNEYGFKFVSSSLFCAEKVIWEALGDPRAALEQHSIAGCPGMTEDQMKVELQLMLEKSYVDPQSCFKDRMNFRTAWFSLIAGYIYPDKARLAREIFAENDVYVGIRAAAEFHATVNSGEADLVIWVDAKHRLPFEDPGSMQLEPWMAHHVIDNNGSEDDLRNNVVTLLSTLGIKGLDE